MTIVKIPIASKIKRISIANIFIFKSNMCNQFYVRIFVRRKSVFHQIYFYCIRAVPINGYRAGLCCVIRAINNIAKCCSRIPAALNTKNLITQFYRSGTYYRNIFEATIFKLIDIFFDITTVASRDSASYSH
mgnify:CR=1 FL=1